MRPTRLKQLRQLLWLYFWLLIFEGALRRWVLPGLSNPLLLVRDPIALIAIFLAWPLLNKRPWKAWIKPLLWIAPIALVLAITQGHGDLFTALYGCRVLVFQLPLIFVFAAVFNRDDVIRFSWVLLWLCIPMTVLIAAQSNLPATHLLNIGAGGVGTATFRGALGRFRPPGTFSFITGVSSFFTLAVAALFTVLYSAQIRKRGRMFCILAAIALVVALPVSISRSLLAGYLQVMAAMIAALALSRSRLVPVVSGLIALIVALWIATSLPVFQQTSEAFVTRWESAAVSEADETDSNFSRGSGVFQTRVLSKFITPLANLENHSLVGLGIGSGSNVGAQRLTGELTFLVGETAWSTTMGELGLFLGLPFLIWRISLSLWMLRLAMRAAVKGNRLPLIITGCSFLSVLIGQMGQPTDLGFLVLSAGLTLAACNDVSASPTSRYRRITTAGPSLVAHR